MNELNRCICGGIPKLDTETIISGYYFECPECGFQSGATDSFEYARQAWNKETSQRIRAVELGIKPCPFCGRMPAFIDKNERGHTEISCWADCPCEALVQEWGSNEAVLAWNRRPQEEVLEVRVKELELEVAAADCLDGEASIGAKELMTENERLRAKLTKAKAAAVQWVTYDGARIRCLASAVLYCSMPVRTEPLWFITGAVPTAAPGAISNLAMKILESIT